MSCEEYFVAEVNVVEVKAEELPAATYLGKDLWRGLDGTLFLVVK